MPQSNVEQLVTDIVEEILGSASEIELVDVEFVREGDWILRVFLDKPGGLDVEDCRYVSEILGDKLDEKDPIPQAYYLEVSSPGLERVLKKDRDFERYRGQRIEIHTFAPVNGTKTLIGDLIGLEDDGVAIELNDDKVIVPRQQVSLVRLHVDF